MRDGYGRVRGCPGGGMTGMVSGSWLVAGRKEKEPIDGVIALEIKKKCLFGF